MNAMLASVPIGADEKATAYWKATNMLTEEIFATFFQKGSADLPLEAQFELLNLGTEASDAVSYAEWEDEECHSKHYGTRKLNGARHGIVRNIYAYTHDIEEATYYEDKLHGLSFNWNCNGPAFIAVIYDKDEVKASISWTSDWSEEASFNKEMILENDGLSLFKP